ncbi:hypothetical protein V6Z11_D03G031400 [Gossypium hirsutum]
MVSPEFSLSQFSPMAKPRNRSFWCLSDSFLYCGGVFLAILLVCSFWSFFTPTLNFSSAITDPSSAVSCKESGFGVNLKSDPKGLTFYDDPELSYSIEKPVKNWDEKRKQWLNHHPSFAAGASERIVVVTGSQPKPFVKAAMLTHPEAEWIWWVDSDALFTDMEFKLPLQRYKNHNLVVHGWPELIYDKKSWTSLNAGVFLIRNCQWSMDLIETWSNMGPISKDYKKWGEIQRSTFKDKLFPESDDQTALIYLLYKHKEKYYDHIYLEGEFYFEGYWVEIFGRYENTTEMYLAIERGTAELRRRHAEKVSEQYGAFREEYLKSAGNGKGSWRRPLITHFTGCQPCNGDHNKMYDGESCWNGMVKALNFADNQVLRKYGFIHPDLLDSSIVSEVPFDYPADEGPW